MSGKDFLHTNFAVIDFYTTGVAHTNSAVIDSYVTGAAIMLLLVLVCSALCYKSMSNNRGNFINLPTWRKVVKAITNLLLYTLLGVFLWQENHMAILSAFVIVLGFLLSVVAVCWLVFRIRSYWKSWKAPQAVLSNKGIPNYHYVLNKSVMEYIAYAFCWLSKGLIVALVALLSGWQIANNIWPEILGTITGVGAYILSPLSFCLYICFAVALTSSITFIILVITVEQLTQAPEDNEKLEHEKWEIRRNFRFREHDV